MATNTRGAGRHWNVKFWRSDSGMRTCAVVCAVGRENARRAVVADAVPGSVVTAWPSRREISMGSCQCPRASHTVPITAQLPTPPPPLDVDGIRRRMDNAWLGDPLVMKDDVRSLIEEVDRLRASRPEPTPTAKGRP